MTLHELSGRRGRTGVSPNRVLAATLSALVLTSLLVGPAAGAVAPVADATEPSRTVPSAHSTASGGPSVRTVDGGTGVSEQATPGDEWDDEQATPIAPNTTASGSIDPSDDVDRLSLNVRRGDLLDLTLRKPADQDIQMRVTHPTGTTTSAAEINGTALGERFIISENGTVEIAISGPGTGNWTLTNVLNRGADRYPNKLYLDDPSERVFVDANTTVTGRLQTTDDTDRLDIEVERGDVLNLVLSKPVGEDIDIYVRYPLRMERIDFQSGPDKRTFITSQTIVRNGTVRILIEGSGTGDWTLTNELNRGVDRFNQGDRVQIDPNTTVSGRLQTSDDRDEFGIEVSRGDVLHLTLEKPVGRNVGIRTVPPGGSFGGIGATDESTLTGTRLIRENGTFRIDVNGDVGDWTLTNELNPGVDKYPQTRDDFTRVEQNTTVSGRLQTTDDEDHVGIDVRRGDVLSLTLERPVGRDIALGTGDAREVGDGVYTDTQLITRNGTFEAVVYGNGIGDWTLTNEVNRGADKFVEGDRVQIGANATVSGRLQTDDDREDLAVRVSENDVLNLTLEKPAGQDVGLRVRYPNDESAVVRGIDEAQLSINRTITEDAIVTIEISGPGTGDWTLTTERRGDEPTTDPLDPVCGDCRPPTDVDGDGLYEDVNGDGSVNVIDVQALFANLDDPTIRNNVDAFDYNGDGSVNVVDVQALFANGVDV
jgi:hypothetical protein